MRHVVCLRASLPTLCCRTLRLQLVEGGQPVVVPDPSGAPTLPSVVAFTADGSVLVGAAAKRQAAVNPKSTFYSGWLAGRLMRGACGRCSLAAQLLHRHTAQALPAPASPPPLCIHPRPPGPFIAPQSSG